MFFLIRPVGLRCQLTCGYCYYKDGHDKIRRISAERMPLSVVEALLCGLPSLRGEHTFCLHGGEPLLIGKKWFRQVADLVSQYNRGYIGVSSVSLTVQTNAMLIDEDWVDLFAREGIGVSLSLDGPAEVHDSARTKGHRAGTHAEVLSAIEALSRAGIRIGCLAVVTARTLELGASRFYEYFRTVPLLNGLDVNPYVETGTSLIEMSARKEYEPDPDELASFLCDLFDLWLYDSNMVKRVDIRMFEQLVGVALYFVPSLCYLTQGASCGRTPSIMPNGDVYACDLDLHGFDFRMGSLLSESIADICSPPRLSTLNAKVASGLERRGCTQCGFVAYCGLTCPRHTFSARDHSPYCKMMGTLVSHVKGRLNAVSCSLYAEEIEFSPEMQLSHVRGEMQLSR